MSLFTFRRKSKESGTAPHPGFEPNSASLDESMDVIRRRARHRLIGSAVLVLAAVGLFPVLFETQPRPVPADMVVEIPSREIYKPLQLPSPSPSATQASSAPEKIAPILVPNRPLAQEIPAQAAINSGAKPAASRLTPTAAAAPAASKPAAAKAVASNRADGADEAARARALLNDEAPSPAAAAKKPPATAAASATSANPPQSAAQPGTAAESSRVVVQVGAFADAGKAGEIRARLEQAGLKSYTQAVDTNDGKRIRVRVGPFASRAEADKAAAKIRAMDLPAAILSL